MQYPGTELRRIPLLETVWKIARGLLDCGHGLSTVSKIVLLGQLLAAYTAVVGSLLEFPDSLSRRLGE
jgi:hypothetical protein